MDSGPLPNGLRGLLVRLSREAPFALSSNALDEEPSHVSKTVSGRSPLLPGDAPFLLRP
jgi:hypothetical protein